jgi:tRNA(Ile)-lysidine synthase TilS/MesJ
MALFLSQATKRHPYRLKRPLLGLTRAEVTFLMTVINIPISADSTNQAGQSTRSQIRYALLPLIYQLGFHGVDEMCVAFLRFLDGLTGTRTRN